MNERIWICGHCGMPVDHPTYAIIDANDGFALHPRCVMEILTPMLKEIVKKNKAL